MLFDQRADFVLVLATAQPTGVLIQPDADPTLRVYGAAGLVGSPAVDAFAEGTITDVQSNGSGGSRLTSTAHPFLVGDAVVIAGVGGATGVNGTKVVTAAAANTFDVASAPGGAYTSGGEAVAAGLYAATIDASLRNALEPGRAYTAVWRYAVSAAPAAVAQPFAVV